jgi:hypothetical protein
MEQRPGERTSAAHQPSAGHAARAGIQRPDALHAGADRHQTEHSQNDACAEQQRPRRPRRIRSAQGLPLRRPQPARARRDAWHCRREQARTSAVPHPALRRHSPYAQPRPWPEPWRPGRRRRDGAPEANTLASGLSLLLRPGAAAARARPPEQCAAAPATPTPRGPSLTGVSETLRLDSPEARAGSTGLLSRKEFGSSSSHTARNGSGPPTPPCSGSPSRH